jgi:hypothetical protein
MATSHGLTLLDVIQAVGEVAENDLEIIATVAHLISSGQVRLHNDAIGAMRHLVASVDAAAQSPAEEHTGRWHYATQERLSCGESPTNCFLMYGHSHTLPSQCGAAVNSQ